jgi:hypothetical protein
VRAAASAAPGFYRAREAHYRPPVMGRTLLRIVDSNASLLVLLLANFFFLELIDDPRWGALLSTLLAAAALVVAISDPDAGTTITKRHAISIRSSSSSTPSPWSGSRICCLSCCS